jgi:predicted Zn-dependent peptidase
VQGRVYTNEMHHVEFGSMANKLRTVIIHRPHLHRAVVTAHVGVGSRHETNRTNGLSHFLEHMLFRGTALHKDAPALNEAVERLGGDLLASTHADYTTYELSVPPNAVEQACVVLGAMLSSPTFEDMVVEKSIVREEILEDLDETGRILQVDTLARNYLFAPHPLGMPITGTIANVNAFTERDLRRHHQRYYNASNSCVTVCSPLKTKDVRRAIEKGFAKLSCGEPQTPKPTTVDQERARVRFMRRMSNQTCVRIGFATPGAESKHGRAVELLTRVLHDGMSTRLHRRICDELGLAYEISAGLEQFRDVGVFEIASSVAHESVPQLVRELLAMLAALAIEGPTEDELAKIRHRYECELDAMDDDPHALARDYGAQALWGNRHSLEAVRREVRSLRCVDLARAARLVFTPMRLNVTLVGDLSDADLWAVRRHVARFRKKICRTYDTGLLRAPNKILVRPQFARAALTVSLKQ